jgi:protein-disulfide isomerase
MYLNLNKENSKMKNIVLLFVSLSLLTGCGKIMQKVIENNPDIVFGAIKKDPEGFFETIESTQDQMREIAQKKAQSKAKDEMEAAFKTPVNPAIAEGRPVWGKKDAPITIVEYADFSCGYCADASRTMAQVKQAYGDKIKVIYKHFHVLGNPNSVYASQLMEGIAKVDVEKAYKFHDIVFENQGKLRESSAKSFLEKEAGKLVGAKLPEVIKTANSDEIKKLIESDKEEAGGLMQLRGTPAFNINGVTLRGAEPFDKLKQVIDRHLENKAQN